MAQKLSLVSLCLAIFTLLALLPFSMWQARGQANNAVAVVSAASFAPVVAPDSIAALFGANLAPRTEAATTQPLPVQLAGTSVTVAGLAAPLFFVSPGQINFLLPPNTPLGSATVVVRAGDGTVASGTVEVRAVAPALFTANASGRGPLAAVWLRVKADGQQRFEPVAQFQDGQFVTKPFELGAESEQVFLVLFLTGGRGVACDLGRGVPCAAVRVVAGGAELPEAPLFVGAVAGLAGLDQLNLRLPRAFDGRGRISLLLKVNNAALSNAGEFELAPHSAEGNNAPLQISGLSQTRLLAGEEVTLTGSGFAASQVENQVHIVSSDGIATKAEVLGVSGTQLRVRVPFGAGSGRIVLSRGTAEASAQVTLRTSVSGFIERFEQGRRVPIPGARVRMVGRAETERVTDAEGSFVMPDLAPASRADFEILPPTAGTLNFPAKRFALRVRAERDNQLPRGDEQTTLSGAAFPLAEAEPEQNLTLTFLEPGRTPANLPVGHFSSAIAQLAPFGVPLSPGRKLTFPNRDALPTGTVARLFKLDPAIDLTAGTPFVDAGTATVTADGQSVETAANAITESGYYFASVPRVTAAISGRVIESDGRPVPRAIVQARGQSTFTDGFGGFVLGNVPVLRVSGDRVRVEVSYQRPDGRVVRKDGNEVELTAGALATVRPDIVLDVPASNRPPVLLAPASLTVEAGRPSDFNFAVHEPDAGQSLQLSVSGASFATLTQNNCTACTLRLAPTAAGDFTVTLRAQDSAGAASTQTIAIKVNAPGSQLVAYDQAVVTDEDTARSITLNSNNAGASYVIVTPPRNGSLSGVGATRGYTPANNFNGVDSFSFKATLGASESNAATVFIAVNPINDAPVLTVPGAQTANAGQELSFLVTASDADVGQRLTCTANNLPPGATLLRQTGTSWRFSWTPVLLQAGSYTVSFSITDDGVPAQSAQRSVVVTAQAQWAKTSGPEGAEIRAFAFKGAKVFAATESGSLYVSNNNAQSWMPTSGGLPAAGFAALAVKDDKIFAATGDEVYVSRDDGQSWTLPSRDLASNGADQVLALAVSGARLYAGTYARGVFVSEDDGRTWVRMSAGLPDNPVQTFAVVGTQLYAGLFSRGVFTSNDGARNWTSAGLDGQRINAIVARGNKLFATAYEQGVYVSTDNGRNWTLINQGLTSQAVGPLVTSGAKLFVGTQYNGIFVTENDGQSWRTANQGLNDTTFKTLATNGARLYAGALSGGVYTSDNEGQSWTVASQGLTNARVLALAVTPSKTFAGIFGGLAVTSNNGQDWTRTGNGLPNDQFMRALIVVDNKIFAGSNNSGVFRSTDGGANWTFAGLESGYIRTFARLGGRLFAGDEFGNLYVTSDDGANWTPAAAGLPQDEIETLLAHGTTLYAGLSESGVYLSRDQGQSWTPVNTGLTNRNVRALAASGNALYAGTSLGGVFVSRDEGQSWQPLNTGLSDRVVNSLLVIGTRLLAGTYAGGAFLLNEAGTSWTQLRTGLSSVNSCGCVSTKEIYRLALHGDSIIAATDDGAYLLANATQSWALSNNGLANTSVNTVFATAQTVFAGTLGGGVYRSLDQGQSWAATSAGLPANANVQAFTALGAHLFAASYGEGVFRSSNNGAAWVSANNGLTNRYITALATRGNKLFAATTTEPQTNNPGGVFVSTNNGETWTASNAGLTNRKVNTLAAIDTKLLAGTDGGVFVSNDEGASWTAQNVGLRGNALFVRAFVALGNAIFAATDGAGVYRSLDGGASWAAVNQELPPTLNVYALAVSGKRLYAGSIYGVFASEDQGAAWQQVNAGLVDVFVTGLAVSGERLIVGTLRGGVFVSTIPQ